MELNTLHNDNVYVYDNGNTNTDLWYSVTITIFIGNQWIILTGWHFVPNACTNITLSLCPETVTLVATFWFTVLYFVLYSLLQILYKYVALKQLQWNEEIKTKWIYLNSWLWTYFLLEEHLFLPSIFAFFNNCLTSPLHEGGFATWRKAGRRRMAKRKSKKMHMKTVYDKEQK